MTDINARLHQFEKYFIKFDQTENYDFLVLLDIQILMKIKQIVLIEIEILIQIVLFLELESLWILK